MTPNENKYSKHSTETSIENMPVIIPQHCNALYITCSIKHVGTVSSHLQPTNMFNIDENQNTLSMELQDMYLWPWIAKIHTDGEYRCLGVLIDISWILVENSCLNNTVYVLKLKTNFQIYVFFLNLSFFFSFEKTYVTAVLGTKRLIPNIRSPYQQTIRIDNMNTILFSTITLFHLEKEVLISRHVKPISLNERYK